MISSFKHYLKIGKVKNQTPDPEEARALFKQSEERMQYIQLKDINKTTAKFVLEDAYEAAREAAQSLMSIKGFKPYSHEATISFIKEFHSSDFNEEEINKFDHFREMRNNSVYRAVEVAEADARESIVFAETIIRRISMLIKKN